jgi:hypothetical protein
MSEMDERDRYASGMKHRRAVLGDAWVQSGYAGMPAANPAIHHAQEVIAERSERSP